MITIHAAISYDRSHYKGIIEVIYYPNFQYKRSVYLYFHQTQSQWLLYLIWISFNFYTNSTPVLGFKFHFQLNLSGKLLAGDVGGGEWNSHLYTLCFHRQNHQIIERVSSDLKVNGKLYWIPHCTKALQLPSSRLSRIQCIKEKSLGIFWNKILH